MTFCWMLGSVICNCIKHLKMEELYWRGAEYATLKHVTLAYRLFWVKVMWETAGTRILWPFFVPKQEITLLCERYPPYIRRVESIFFPRNREFGAKKTVETKLVTSSLIHYSKSKLLFPIDSSQIYSSSNKNRLACLGYCFEFHIIWTPVHMKLVFLLLISFI